MKGFKARPCERSEAISASRLDKIKTLICMVITRRRRTWIRISASKGMRDESAPLPPTRLCEDGLCNSRGGDPGPRSGRGQAFRRYNSTILRQSFQSDTNQKSTNFPTSPAGVHVKFTPAISSPFLRSMKINPGETLRNLTTPG